MKRTISIISLLVLGMAVAAAYVRDRIDERYLDAVRQYVEDDYAEASRNLEAVLEDDPDNDAAWYYLGLCRMSMEDNEEGIRCLEKAVALDSMNYWYMDRLAMAYTVISEREKAVAQYEDLVERFPRKLDACYTLTNLYLGMGELDKAVRTIEAIEELSGQTDVTVLTRYRILLHRNRPEEALDALRSYSEEYSSPQVLAMLGDHEAGLSEDSLALAYYDEALALDKTYPPALLGKAEVHRLSRRYDDFFSILRSIMSDPEVDAAAKTDYLGQLVRHVDQRFVQNNRARLDSCHLDMLKAHPSDTSVLRTAGIYFYNVGDLDRAEETFRRNALLNPGRIGLSMDLVEFYALTGQNEALLETCDALLARNPALVELENIALSAEFSLGRYADMIARAESLVARFPSDSAICLMAYSSIGDVCHMTGQDKKAYKAYDKALKINPAYAPVLNNYAYYLSEEKRSLKKAYRMSRRTIEQEPDNATYLDTFAWILHLMGKDLEAKPFFKHAMLYGGKESATVLEHYSTVLEALGENDLAKVYGAQAEKLRKDEERGEE